MAKYRSYDSDGNEVKGIFQQIFEEEYARLVNDEFHLFDEDYNEYLRRFYPYQTHRGYFSIDKKGHMVDSKTKRGSDVSEEPSDYELILKDKERLLSFDEPTRFIFSHSALREGWDNPNVFQICTLRHSNSGTAKRQEVGRGLRICVDRNGVRQDKELLGEAVHDVNILTVIANESYADFSSALQKETKEALRERAVKASSDYFEGKTVTVGGSLTPSTTARHRTSWCTSKTTIISTAMATSPQNIMLMSLRSPCSLRYQTSANSRGRNPTDTVNLRPVIAEEVDRERQRHKDSATIAQLQFLEKGVSGIMERNQPSVCLHRQLRFTGAY